MPWLVIDATTHEIVSGPHDAQPADKAGTYSTMTIMGWPRTARWTPAARGFLPRSIIDTITQPAPPFQSWAGPANASELAALKEAVVVELKDQAEQLKMRSLSAGGAKKDEYAGNKAEVRDADQLGGALLTLLNTLKVAGGSALETRFPNAAANAAEFGDTIQDALNRFRGGIARSLPCPKISAREAKICTDVRAAPTFAALVTVLAKHKWPTA